MVRYLRSGGDTPRPGLVRRAGRQRATIEEKWAFEKAEAEWAGSQRAVLRNNTVRPEPVAPPAWRAATLEISLDGSRDGRGLRVIAESARVQYSALGLRVVERKGPPGVVLSGPNGRQERAWKGYAPAKDVVWLIRQFMGAPRSDAARP